MYIEYDKVKQRPKIKNMIDVMKANKEYDKQFPNGIIIFSGEQGSGKTLTATYFIKRYIEDIQDVVVITNTDTIFNTQTYKYNGIKSINEVWEHHNDKMIILYIDEITSEFNSLDSKEFNVDWFTIINMMRKRNLLIIGTCPLFTRLSKAFREQFDSWFVCTKGILGLCIRLDLYKNKFDGVDVSEDTIDNSVFVKRYRHWVSLEDYMRYDTKAIIQTNRKDVKQK